MANWKKVIVSGSHAHLANITASGEVSAVGGFTGSLHGTASNADYALSSSHALTASFALNADNTGFPFSGSDNFTAVDDDGIGYGGIGIITGSLFVSTSNAGDRLGGNITASGQISAGRGLIVTGGPISASGVSSSFLSASGADITSASLGDLYVDGIISASGAVSASRLFVSGNIRATGDVDAGSFSINGFTLLDAQNNVISGSNVFGSGSDNTHQFTGSLFISGANLTADGTTISASAFQGALTGTASFATRTLTSSYAVSASSADYSVSASSADYSVSASAALYTVSASAASYSVSASAALYTVSASAALYSVSASAAIMASGSSMAITASHAVMASGSSMALTASHAEFVVSASYALTSSHAEKVKIDVPVDTAGRLPLVFLDTDGVLKVGDISPDQDGPTYDVDTNKLELGRGGNVGIELHGGNGTAADSFIRVKGNLFVEGATTTLNVSDLAVEDKFILLNSHSAAAPAVSDAGIIVQTSGSTDVGGTTYKHFGTALYYSQDQNRWVLAKSSSVEAGAGSITQNDGFVVSVSSSNLPVTAAYDPLNFSTNMQFGGGSTGSYGMMYIDEGEPGREAGLFIYMPGALG